MAHAFNPASLETNLASIANLVIQCQAQALDNSRNQDRGELEQLRISENNWRLYAKELKAKVDLQAAQIQELEQKHREQKIELGQQTDMICRLRCESLQASTTPQTEVDSQMGRSPSLGRLPSASPLREFGSMGPPSDSSRTRGSEPSPHASGSGRPVFEIGVVPPSNKMSAFLQRQVNLSESTIHHSPVKVEEVHRSRSTSTGAKDSPPVLAESSRSAGKRKADDVKSEKATASDTPNKNKRVRSRPAEAQAESPLVQAFNSRNALGEAGPSPGSSKMKSEKKSNYTRKRAAPAAPLSKSRTGSTEGDHGKFPSIDSLAQALQFWDHADPSIGLNVPLKDWAVTEEDEDRLRIVREAYEEFFTVYEGDEAAFGRAYPELEKKGRWIDLCWAITQAKQGGT